MRLGSAMVVFYRLTANAKAQFYTELIEENIFRTYRINPHAVESDFSGAISTWNCPRLGEAMIGQGPLAAGFRETTSLLPTDATRSIRNDLIHGKLRRIVCFSIGPGDAKRGQKCQAEWG
jgi:hypothetical protein